MPYRSADLLSRGGMDQHAGEAHDSVPPELPNLLDVPEMVTSLAEALAAMESASKGNIFLSIFLITGI